MFHAELGKELNAWVQANASSSERGDRGSDGLQRDFAGAEAETCAAKHGNGKAAGTDNIVNYLMKYGGGIILITTVMLYSSIWEKEDAPDRWREGIVVTCSRNEIRLTRGTA